jgi:hypothetical protein
MNNYARKAWAIIGYTWNGAAYCPECAPNPDTGEHTPYTCDTCSTEIE